ncbi:MAG: FkbM family methyltransferase [Acidobacteriia bacterium]|nr:FkbM family methyltransferase [Terriglobia bacterium]
MSLTAELASAARKYYKALWKRRSRAREAAFLESLRTGLGDLQPDSAESAQYIQSAQAKLSLEQILELAQGLAYIRPLTPYAGWRFDADWNNPDLAYRLRRAIWERFNSDALGHELVVDWYLDMQLCIRMGNDLSKQIFIGGCNEPNEMAFLAKELKPGMTLVDAGAMEGIYTVLGARVVGANGKVYAFEPSRRERASLARNLELNRLQHVQVFEAALSDADGEGMLCVANDEHSGQNTLGGLVFDGAREVERIPVKLRRLDTVAAAEGWTRLDFLKMDVEGAEMRLLRGAEETLSRFHPVILFEISERLLEKQGANPEQLIRWLTERDYLLYRFGSDGALEPAADGMGDNMVAAPKHGSLR